MYQVLEATAPTMTAFLWTKSRGRVCRNRRSTTVRCVIVREVDRKHQVWETDGANEGKHFETSSKCHTLSALPLMTGFVEVKGHSTFLTLSSLPLEMGGYPGSYNGYSKEDSLSIQHLPVPCHHQHYTSFISEHCETLKCRWRVGRPRYCDDRESLHGCDELEFRGDKDTSTSKLGGDSALLPKGHTRQGSSRKETDTTVQYPVDSQGDGRLSNSSSSSQSQKNVVPCISRARRILVVNVLGLHQMVMQYCLEVFQMAYKSSPPSDTPTTTKGLQLMQVFGCLTDGEDPTWISSSELVQGEGIEAILCNSCLTPLFVVLPVDDIITSEVASVRPVWIAQLNRLLGCLEQSPRQIVFLGIVSSDCKYDNRVLRHLVSNHGIHTENMFFVSKPSDPAVVLSVHSAILKVLNTESTSVSLRLELEKMVLLERLHQTKKMSLEKLITNIGDSTDLMPSVNHLMRTGLCMNISYDIRSDVMEVEDDYDAIFSPVSPVKSALISPHKLLQESNEISKLLEVCKIAHAEVNDNLLPVAQHGLIPKDKITFTTLLLQDLHKLHLLLDPMLADSEHEQSSETSYVFPNESRSHSDKHEYAVINARHCYLVPTCLKNESLSPLLGYTQIPPLAFRYPGCHKKVIPVSVFYQLVVYLMLRFPSSVKCLASSARFHVAARHLLDVTYAETYIEAVVYVHNGVSALPAVCSSINAMICARLNALSNASSSFVIHPAVLLRDCNSLYPDFVDLVDVNIFKVKKELYSIGGQEFIPSGELMIWFGKHEAVQEHLAIRGYFHDIIDEVDPVRAASWLYERTVFSASDLDHMLSQDANARSLLLYRLLEKKGSMGLEAVDALLHDNTLRKTRRPGINAETQTLPSVTQGSNRLHEGSQQTPIESEVQEASSLHTNVQQTSDRKPEWLNQLSTSSEPKANTNPMLPPMLHQQNQGVLTTSMVTYSGIHEEELAFPRSQPTSIRVSTVRPSVEHATETNQENTDRKGDPEVHPIFESKYWHVERATDTFNEVSMKDGGKRLGVGSFGTVFHGVLHSETGQTFQVAVKRFKKASSLSAAQVALSRRQFGTEMNLLTRYLHKNIVRLLGFSSDGPELCLIYEYMEMGALSHRLDCKNNSLPLDWRVRLTIARDVGSALEFLHTAYRLPVVHRDVKSSNVLLSGTFEAKLSDFGLAMVIDADGDIPKEVEQQSSVGTRPYMAPEIFQGIVSTKGDIYGLGMILFELATGLPPYSSRKKQDLKAYLEDMERQNIDVGKLLDPKARWPKSRDNESKEKSVGLELIQVAKSATISDHALRPDIMKVLPELKLLVEKN
ncbi:uncharacterized protein LOC134189521 isoform X2 [Corticium candelabrum]|uniref:uncharacterized protein LOC134189521 isoform X2 n=1 Tax=Corticium candelabrum TaxID=121492 RepID=UPI002E255DCE|nr:uncharacterized protein LOC134189521 isoform X2 [Corticium candelabrum]